MKRFIGILLVFVILFSPPLITSDYNNELISTQDNTVVAAGSVTQTMRRSALVGTRNITIDITVNSTDSGILDIAIDNVASHIQYSINIFVNESIRISGYEFRWMREVDVTNYVEHMTDYRSLHDYLFNDTIKIGTYNESENLVQPMFYPLVPSYYKLYLYMKWKVPGDDTAYWFGIEMGESSEIMQFSLVAPDPEEGVATLSSDLTVDGHGVGVQLAVKYDTKDVHNSLYMSPGEELEYNITFYTGISTTLNGFEMLWEREYGEPSQYETYRNDYQSVGNIQLYGNMILGSMNVSEGAIDESIVPILPSYYILNVFLTLNDISGYEIESAIGSVLRYKITCPFENATIENTLSSDHISLKLSMDYPDNISDSLSDQIYDMRDSIHDMLEHTLERIIFDVDESMATVVDKIVIKLQYSIRYAVSNTGGTYSTTLQNLFSLWGYTCIYSIITYFPVDVEYVDDPFHTPDIENSDMMVWNNPTWDTNEVSFTFPDMFVDMAKFLIDGEYVGIKLDIHDNEINAASEFNYTITFYSDANMTIDNYFIEWSREYDRTRSLYEEYMTVSPTPTDIAILGGTYTLVGSDNTTDSTVLPVYCPLVPSYYSIEFTITINGVTKTIDGDVFSVEAPYENAEVDIWLTEDDSIIKLVLDYPGIDNFYESFTSQHVTISNTFEEIIERTSGKLASSINYTSENDEEIPTIVLYYTLNSYTVKGYNGRCTTILNNFFIDWGYDAQYTLTVHFPIPIDNVENIVFQPDSYTTSNDGAIWDSPIWNEQIIYFQMEADTVLSAVNPWMLVGLGGVAVLGVILFVNFLKNKLGDKRNQFDELDSGL